MRNRLFISLFAILVLLINSAWANPTDKTVISKKVELISGNDTINYIRLENTHNRMYSDIFSGYQFSLKENIEGVIWKILCVGVRIDKPLDKIILQNENEQLFTPLTNIIETSGNSKATDKDGKVIYEGPKTSFFLAGPDNSIKVTIMFGDSSVQIEMNNK